MILRQHRCDRSGFTLLEVTAVLAIIALVAFLSYPSFQSWLQTQKLRDAIDSFRTDLVRARTKAMEEGRPYRCHWEMGGSYYRFAPDEIESWPELAGSAIAPFGSAASNLPGGVGSEHSLPEGIRLLGTSTNPLGAEAGRSFSGMSGGGEYVVFEPDGSAVILLPDGMDAPQIDIVLGADNGEERVLRLRAVTSVMTTFNPRLP